MDRCWDESFRIFARENLAWNFDTEKLKQVLDAKQKSYQKTTNVINYLTSHHRHHLLAAASFRTLDPEAAFKRAKLRAVLLVTAVKTPILWMAKSLDTLLGKLPTSRINCNNLCLKISQIISCWHTTNT